MNSRGTLRPMVIMGEHDSKATGLHFAELLADRQQQAALTVVDINEFLDNYVEALRDIIDKDELRTLVLDQRREQLKRSLQRHKPTYCRYENIKVLEGIPFIEVIRECLNSDSDLIIKVAGSDAAQRSRHFGSTDLHLIRKSPVPVMILDPLHPEIPDSLLAAVDVSSSHMDALNEHIVDQAAAVADQFGCELHLMTAWQLQGENTMRYNPLLKIDEQRIARITSALMNSVEARMQALARRVRKVTKFRNNPHIHITKGLAETAIPELLDQYQIKLLLMGTVGHIDIPGLFIGTTAESILNRVNCSVLTMKPPGFITPVALKANGIEEIPNAPAFR